MPRYTKRLSKANLNIIAFRKWVSTAIRVDVDRIRYGDAKHAKINKTQIKARKLDKDPLASFTFKYRSEG